MTRLRRILPRRLAVFTVGSPSMTRLSLPSRSSYEFRIRRAISDTDRTVFSPDHQTDCDRARAEEGTQTPSLPRTPSRLRRATQLFCQSELECRHARSVWAAVGGAVADGWGVLVLSIGKAGSIVVPEPFQLRSDFTRLHPSHQTRLPALTTSDIPTNMPRENQILRVTSLAVQPSAGLPSSHSFHGEVCRSGRLLLSIPLLQLCAAHTPKPGRARFRALRLRSAPEIDSASLRSVPR
jgi:hypothetical protein